MESSEFYGKFASQYREYALKRGAYLRSVDDLIKADMNGRRSVIDIGAGDGTRLQKILGVMNDSVRVIAVDNSDGMIALLRKISGLTVLDADIASSVFYPVGKYDIILCLWNVIGHITTERGRITAMKNMADLLEDDGIIFLDVNNRYNVIQYGLRPVLINIIKDVFNRDGRNGDFALTMEADGKKIGTTVHLFGPSEIERLINVAGLRISQRWIINYETGRRANNVWGGQLVYKLVKS